MDNPLKKIRQRKVSEGTTVVTSEDTGATEVHVNVDEEPKRGRIASWIVTGMGAISALAAAAATTSVGLNSANTSNALQDLAAGAEEETQMQLNLAHQEQVLPVRLEVAPADGIVPEGYDLVEISLVNPGSAMLMDAAVELPAESLIWRDEELVRTNRLDFGVVVDEASQLALVPAGADSFAAEFTTSWDPRERWALPIDASPTLTTCTFPGGEGGSTEVPVSDVPDFAQRTWIGCDVVFDEVVAGSLGGLEVPGVSGVPDVPGVDNPLDGGEGTVSRGRQAVSDVELADPTSTVVDEDEAAELLSGGNPLQ